jgi:hypothetical protein
LGITYLATLPQTAMAETFQADRTIDRHRREPWLVAFRLAADAGAPEQLSGGVVDRRLDVYATGVVLWEALTLKRLFKGGNDSDTMAQVLDTAILAPSNVNGDVLADFDAIVLRALERDPSKRYPTAKAMAAEIEEVLRKHGYAAKNDMIARYMQATFESHITARKKLLQEVSSKGRASPDVLEAAFHSSTLASGSHPSSSELLSKRRPAASTARVAPDAGADEAPQVTAELDPRTDGGDTVVEPPRASNKRWLAYPAAAGVIVAVLVMTTLVAGRRPRRANGPAPAAPAPRGRTTRRSGSQGSSTLTATT